MSREKREGTFYPWSAPGCPPVHHFIHLFERFQHISVPGFPCGLTCDAPLIIAVEKGVVLASVCTWLSPSQLSCLSSYRKMKGGDLKKICLYLAFRLPLDLCLQAAKGAGFYLCLRLALPLSFHSTSCNGKIVVQRISLAGFPSCSCDFFLLIAR